MEIAQHLIDQKVHRLVELPPPWLEEERSERRVSTAFLCLGMASYLNLELEEAARWMTDGADDAGIDGVHIETSGQHEFSVLFFQAKYHTQLDTAPAFPANAVLRMVNTVRILFTTRNPLQQLKLNDRLRPLFEEILELMRDDHIPNVRCVFLSNGDGWNDEGYGHIRGAGFDRDQSIAFEHFNHTDMLRRMENIQPVDETLYLSGETLQEEFAFRRVLVGKMNVLRLAELVEKHKDALFEKNIRNYLGTHNNRVNSAIRSTLLDPEKRKNFYFFNNGITMLCSELRRQRVEDSTRVRVKHLQIINGGQTSRTVQETIQQYPDEDYAEAHVLIRLYDVGAEEEETLDFTRDITEATNSQNPVDLRNLRANDTIQKQLATGIEEMGYHDQTRVGTTTHHTLNANTIPATVAAEAVLTIWRRKPHKAKFKRSELFGYFYNEIFDGLLPAQLILAVVIFRFCDSRRKRSQYIDIYIHTPYSNYFASTLIGEEFLRQHGLADVKQLNHRNFSSLMQTWETEREAYYEQVMSHISQHLKQRYDLEDLTRIDGRKLSALFRQIEFLDELSESLAQTSSNTP